MNRFLQENSYWIFFSTYLKELKDHNRKKLHEKEDFIRIYFEI